jgi:phenylpropionate dioxygenase-like ring-hydroxylating dioxygenase large terminal subunit
LRYFGQDLVLFRGEDGSVHLLDAYCPHLGAHMGIGGRVRGDALQCPFHHWRFNGDGQCVRIPYAQTIPPRARVRSWPLREVNGQIMAYHGPEGAAPAWEFPAFPESTSREWTAFCKAHHWKIRTHVQEIGENGMDPAHFPLLHGQQTASVRTVAMKADGPFFSHELFQTYNIFGLAKLWVREVVGPLEVRFYGLGCAVNRAIVQAKVQLHYTFAFFFTPIDEEYIEVNSMLSMKRVGSRVLNAILLKKAIREGAVTVGQDIPILETKLYRATPILCEGDGPIMAFRKWARQFYPSEAGCGDISSPKSSPLEGRGRGEG